MTAVAALAAGGIAYAAIPSGSGGAISACYSNRSGALRVIDKDAGQGCARGETELSWNQRGVDGRTILSGAGAPTEALGNDGDIYIDTAGFTLSGPKVGGTWPAAVSLVGPAGPTGPKGDTGPALADVDQLAGIACATGTPAVGVVDVAYAPDGAVVLKCRATTTHTLTVTKSGDGTGTVVSSPAGVSCGATCTADFTYPTTVNLTAIPASGSMFSGWSGCGSGGEPVPTCSVTMTGDRSVTATFRLAPIVRLAIVGQGSIMSLYPNLYCPGTCGASVPNGTSLTLDAYPASGWVFTGWSSPCTGTGRCTLSVTGDITITATFAQQPPSG